LLHCRQTSPYFRAPLTAKDPFEGGAWEWHQDYGYCYNAARNNSCIKHHHPFYTPLEKVPDPAIKAAGLKYGGDAEESFLKTFVNPPELKKTLQV
jgi:hypothetical protein